MQPKSDLPQGTLDLLILKVVALGPVHGYAIAQRLEQVSRHVVQVPQGSLYPGKGARNSRLKPPAGNV
jgi:DNA-binding PadR family transcriptional regulator